VRLPDVLTSPSRRLYVLEAFSLLVTVVVELL